MRVRVVLMPDALSSETNYTVQRWCGGQWDSVMSFQLDELREAHEFALKLSLTNRIPVEKAVFEDGNKISGESA